MLTPENLQLHSEAAALLLIWAANLIKAYACYKRLGSLVDKNDMGKTLHTDQLAGVSKNTKIKMRQVQVNQHGEKKEQQTIAIKIKKTGVSPTVAIRQDKGIFGHFLPTKQVIYDDTKGETQLAYLNETKQKDPEFIDISAMRRGLNYHGTDAKALDKENKEIEKERLLKEKQQQSKHQGDDDANAKAEEAKKAEAAKAAAEAEKNLPQTQGEGEGGDKKKDDEKNDKLQMAQVQALPDDVDLIINSMKSVDWAEQDLDVLIELSKQLKYKRLGLFPDTNYMVSLQEAGITGEQITNAIAADQKKNETKM